MTCTRSSRPTPALSVKVLKVVNSAFYGLPGQIANVDRAIVLLGLAAVKNIAIAASIARLFRGKRISEHFSATDLWRHGVGVAVACRMLAKVSPHHAVPDEAFVAGLIHDLGCLVERQTFPEQFAQVIDTCMDDPELSFMECEQKIIGADHQAFGVGLTTKWKFPRHLRAAVGFHHTPDAVSDELRNLCLLVQTADILCCQDQLGFYLTSRGRTITGEMLEALGVTAEQLQQVREELPAGGLRRRGHPRQLAKNHSERMPGPPCPAPGGTVELRSAVVTPTRPSRAGPCHPEVHVLPVPYSSRP